MLVTFIGGPLDGELREVPHRWTYSECGWLEVYYIANGIARHESVSEEEVARRVYGFQEASRRWMNGEPRDAPQCESLAMTLHNPPDKP
jgi:hypothetical protein